MKKILLIVFLLLNLSVYGQNCLYTINGTVKDFHDNTILEGAEIIFSGQPSKVIKTDKNGTFIIKDVCAGNYELFISHEDCEAKKIPLVVENNVLKNYFLEHHIESLEEVVVSNSLIDNRKTEQSEIITSDVIDKYSDASLGDALKNVSGVRSLNTGSTIVKPMINGMHSSRLIILSNDVRLQDQEWGVEHAPTLDINASNTIKVIKGPGALRYGGDAIGGVIIAKPLAPKRKDTLIGKTILSFQENGRGGTIATNLMKTYKNGFYYQGQGTFRKYGDFRAPDYYLTNSGIESKAFSLRGGWNSFEKGIEMYYSWMNNDIAILSASHIGSVGDLVNAINSNEPIIQNPFSYTINNPKQDVSHQIFKLKAYQRFQGFGKLETQYDYQNNHRFEYDIRIGDNTNRPAVDLLLQTHSLSANFKRDADNANISDIGFLYRFQDNEADPSTGVRRLIPDFQKNEFSTYFTHVWKASNNWIIEGGLRYDYFLIDAQKYYLESRWNERNYSEEFSDIIIEDVGTQLLTNPEFTYHNISGSLGFRKDWNSQNSSSFHYGHANRAPNAAELFSDGLHHSAARIELGDLRLGSESSNRLGLNHHFTSNKLHFSLDVYAQWIKDYIFIAPSGAEQTTRGSFPVWEYLNTDAFISGVDVDITYVISDAWQFNNKSSYIYGQDQTESQPLIDMPPFTIKNSIGFTSKNNSIEASLTSEFVGKQTRYPNYNFEQYLPITDNFTLVDISTPPDAYHLFHADIKYTFKGFWNTNTSIQLQCQNILNENYRDYLNRNRFFADDLGRNLKLTLKINY